jgi:hypothetical protein
LSAADPVVTVNASVVRWHRTVADAQNVNPVLSASRNGVTVHAEFLTGIPDEWVATAKAAYRELAARRDADVRRLATHRNDGFSNGPLVPVLPSERKKR